MKCCEDFSALDEEFEDDETRCLEEAEIGDQN